MMDGTAFVLATDPINPVVLGFLPQTGGTRVIWADMKVYNDHVFITRESSNHGMQVFDLTKLRAFYHADPPTTGVRQLTHDAHYTEVTSTHNVVINEETGFAYVASPPSP
jgi:choice-of-anchor B domain-containing protein